MRPEPILAARGLAKRFRAGRQPVAALDGVDIDLVPGRTLALAGESGSGKSTLALCLALLERPDAGAVLFEGRAVRAADRAGLGRFREAVQLVFQDAAGSMNPRFSASEIVSEPLRIRGGYGAAERRRRAAGLLEMVGLPASSAGRLPHEFSGGERRRLALARALATDPQVLILDEALAGLDLSVQGQVANLLLALQRERGLACLFITHDVSLAAAVAEEIAILEAGRIVERAATAELLAAPRHPHTRALLAAAPRMPCAT